MISVSPMLQQARDYEREHTAVSGKEERPLFHLTPPVGWMNDPNGFCRYQGQYHLFFQYHPYSLQWGPMHWGHAVSDDLLRWTYRPCALAPDTETDAGGCYSGSAVETPDGKLLLCYTGVQGADASHDEIQAQCIAVGNGENFEKSPLINGGERTITALIPSPPEADQILLSADAPIHVSAEAHHLSGSAPAMQFLSPLRMDTEA